MTATAPTSATPGRNQPCHCGSGRKYKHCCLPKDDAAAAVARAKAAEEAAAAPSEVETAAPAPAPKPKTHQPWKARTSRGFVSRMRTPRKVGGSQALRYTDVFDVLVARGFCHACAGMTLPNPVSEALHRCVGFSQAGVFRIVGRKFGAWHDGSWWHKQLRDEPLD